MSPRITVVGAGVIGLSCAVRLAEAGHRVDVLARDLPLETTSAVAGGLWMPYLAEPAHEVSRWARLTLETLLDLADSPAEPRTGVAVRLGYLLGTGLQPPPWSRGIEHRIELAGVRHPTARHDDGWQMRVPIVDMSRYLPYLAGRLAAAGGTLTRLSLGALPSRGLVVNCTGLAARALAADPDVHPVQGQVVWLSNPGLDTWWSDEGDPMVYAFPHPGHVVVGGTALEGEWSSEPDPQTAARLVAQARELVPQLQAATVLGHRVGLRPVRSAVRVETVTQAEASIVHCYGHGGSGITLSWGCADDVLAAVTAVTG